MQYEIDVDGFAEQPEETIEFELTDAEIELQTQKAIALAEYDKELETARMMGEEIQFPEPSDIDLATEAPYVPREGQNGITEGRWTL